MQLLHLSLLALLSGSVVAQQDIDNDDIPNQCRSVCQSIVQLTRSCDRQTDGADDDNDRAYLSCVCTASGASAVLPACEACVRTFDDDGRDNDLNDLVRSCSFTTTSYDSTATQPSLANTGAASMTTTDRSGSSTVVAATTLPTGSTTRLTGSSSSSSTTSPTGGSSGTPATQATNPSDSGNAAVGAVSVEMGLLGGLVLGVLGVVGLV